MEKKDISRTIQELYLYPNSKEVNVIHSAAWIVSWLVGIALQNEDDLHAMGGAYFIFAISLLLEFVPIKKNMFISRCVHGLLCITQFLILIGSLPMIFGDLSSTPTKYLAVYVLMGIVPCLGWIVIIAIFFSSILAIMDLHKCFYDEEEEAKVEKEKNYNEFLKFFYENLKGNFGGGNKK